MNQKLVNSNHNLKEYKIVALNAVKDAGEKLIDLSRKKIKYTLKSTHDILAEGDLASENIILSSIKKNFPSHGFFSEEAGKNKSSEYVWVIDPIDGTINFSRHIEDYCISIALTYKGEPILGIIYQPALDKLYLAEKGKGATLNRKKITVSSESKLVNSLLSTDNAHDLKSRQENFDLLSRLCNEVRHTRIFGSAALHLAKIAEGKIDVYFKTNTHYWDYAAGILLIQEAGGKVTDFKDIQLSESSKNIVATNNLLHIEILNLINKQLHF